MEVVLGAILGGDVAEAARGSNVLDDAGGHGLTLSSSRKQCRRTVCRKGADHASIAEVPATGPRYECYAHNTMAFLILAPDCGARCGAGPARRPSRFRVPGGLGRLSGTITKSRLGPDAALMASPVAAP